MQTILGSPGVIGIELARQLPQYTRHIRLVSRQPEKINPEDETFAADLLDPEQTMRAVEGSEIVYLTTGLQYNVDVWREQWPRIMEHVIAACEAHHAKLVFFDNVYMYGRVKGWMTESSAIQPVSEKGKVRAQIAAMITTEVEKGRLTALISRSADFYGPGPVNGVPNLLVLQRLKAGKNAQWLLNANVLHSLTYVPDAGKATAMLGNTPDAFNQVWHLPTQREAITGRQFIQLAAEAFGVPPKFAVLHKWQLRLVALMNSSVRETLEMNYQNEFEYLFDSSKFEKAFHYSPASYVDGIRESVRLMRV